MKILLLEHPRSITPERCNDIANTPLSSCLVSGYAAAMLKQCGHQVEIIEGYLDRLSYEEIGKRIDRLRPGLLGVHMVYHWKRDDELFGFLDGLKKKGLAPHLTAYGFFATVSFRDILDGCSAVDSIILGETETPFPELADALSSGVQYEQVAGLAARDGSGGIRHQPQRPLEDLDSIPFPVRTEALYRLPEVNLLGGRGCYGKCTFCYINTFYGEGAPWRGRSPENIAAEIDRIIAESGKRDFYFTDPNFFGPGRRGQERAVQIAALLKERDIRFGIEGRVNDIHDETIAALVDAGLRHILIGLESGREESLKRMNKMTTVADNERALKILRKHGVEPNVGFIMFEPDSSLQDIRTNFSFLERNDLLRNLSVTANVLYHHQIVLKGTEAYHSLKQEGRLELQDSAYEGAAFFRDDKVSQLASVMRQVTNFLFKKMDGIWSGKIIEEPGAQGRYEKINRLLVEVFERSLRALEAGEHFTDDSISLIVQGAGKEIAETLK